MQDNTDKREDFDFSSVKDGKFPPCSYVTPKKNKPSNRKEIVLPDAPIRENKPTDVQFNDLPFIDLMRDFVLKEGK